MDLTRNVKRESYRVTVDELREHLVANPHLALKTCEKILAQGKQVEVDKRANLPGGFVSQMRHLEEDILHDLLKVGENQKLIDFTPSNNSGFTFVTVETQL